MRIVIGSFLYFSYISAVSIFAEYVFIVEGYYGGFYG